MPPEIGHRPRTASRRRGVTVVIVGCIVLAGILGLRLAATDSPAGRGRPNAGRAAIRVDLDAFDRAPPGPAAPKPTPRGQAHVVLDSTVTGHEMDDLVEVQLPDGAVRVDLRGRFQSALVAEVDDEGNLIVNCDLADGSHDHPGLGSHTHPSSEGPR